MKSSRRHAHDVRKEASRKAQSNDGIGATVISVAFLCFLESEIDHCLAKEARLKG